MLAEDLLVLLHHPDTGRLLVSSGKADVALGGALLFELTERQRIALSDPRRLTGNRIVTIIDPTPSGDDILDEAMQRIPAHRSKRAQVVVSRISRGMRSRLLEHLTEQGMLRAGEARLAGMIPASAWPVAGAHPTDELRRALQHVLAGERSATRREAALISLLHAVGATGDVLGDAEPALRELKRRAEAIAHGDAVGEAVRQALAAAAF